MASISVHGLADYAANSQYFIFFRDARVCQRPHSTPYFYLVKRLGRKNVEIIKYRSFLRSLSLDKDRIRDNVKLMEEREFNIGDTVHWTSQSGGSSKTKTGVIHALIGPGVRPSMFIDKPGDARDHHSYVVKVKSKYYWPRVNHLHLRESETPSEASALYAICRNCERAFKHKNPNTLESDVLAKIYEMAKARLCKIEVR